MRTSPRFGQIGRRTSTHRRRNIGSRCARWCAATPVNEFYGARVYDKPAIALAPTPYLKWLTCRIAMEEYGHHVRFRQLGEQIGIPDGRADAEGRKPLSIFEFPMKSWEEFCVVKLLADLAEIIQVEDLMHCSFIRCATSPRSPCRKRNSTRNSARIPAPSCQDQGGRRKSRPRSTAIFR